jgi:hypothetical protein
VKKRIIVTVTVLGAALALTYVAVRYRNKVTCRREFSVAREFLAETIRSDRPTAPWLEQCAWPGGTDSFFFNIWLEHAGVSASQLARAYTKFPAGRDGTSTILNLHYGRHLPEIQCVVTPTNGVDKVRATFPLNNCLFHPDANEDQRIDEQDLIAWRRQREESQQPPERDK